MSQGRRDHKVYKVLQGPQGLPGPRGPQGRRDHKDYKVLQVPQGPQGPFVHKDCRASQGQRGQRVLQDQRLMHQFMPSS